MTEGGSLNGILLGFPVTGTVEYDPSNFQLTGADPIVYLYTTQSVENRTTVRVNSFDMSVTKICGTQ